MPAPHVDFTDFHRHDLPQRLAAGNGALACDDVAAVGPLGIRLVDSGEAFTYVATGGSVDVVPGESSARTVVELDQESWDGLAGDLDTAPGLLYSGRAVKARGNLLRFVEWEPALRAMYHGRPIVTEAPDLRDRDGAQLDVDRTFTAADDPAEIRHFVNTAGYVVLKDVFRKGEVAAMLAAARALEREASEGDRESWWGRTSDGGAVLCRVLTAARRPVFHALCGDARLTGVAGLADPTLRPRGLARRQGVTVLWKRPDVVEGLADIPWHRDCGMGGHAVNCPILIATVCLTDGGAEAGELRVLPGSHVASFHVVDGTDHAAPIGVPLRVTAGDVSFHYGDVGHASLPPTGATGPHRISALVAFVRPGATHHRGEGHYNDVLLDRDDGQVEHLRDKLARES